MQCKCVYNKVYEKIGKNFMNWVDEDLVVASLLYLACDHALEPSFLCCH